MIVRSGARGFGIPRREFIEWQMTYSTTIVVPHLLTERLVMRAFTERDAEPYITMMTDPEVARFLGDGRPLAALDAWRQMAMFAGHWALRGFGMWAVEERASGALVGRVGLHEPPGWPGFELGYALGRRWWGRGYAREAGVAALAYARETLGRDEIISVIRPDNARSIAVATALGATRAESIEFFSGTSVIYRYPRSTTRRR